MTDSSSAHSHALKLLRSHLEGIGKDRVRVGSAAVILLAVLALTAALPAAARPDNRDTVLQSGIRAFQARDFAAAEQAFSHLATLEPSARNYNYLAMAEAANGEPGPAITDFRKSIRLGNNSPSVHYNLGLAYVQGGQAETAVEEFHQALSLDPKYLPARYALGMTLLHLGRAAQAVDTISEARKQAPRDPRLWAALAEAQFQAGDAKQAVETAQDAAQAIPDNPRLAVTLASDCLRYGQIQAARNLLEDANEVAPENQEIRILLAKASLMAGEPVEALAVLRGMPSSGPQHTEKLHLMGEARALTGNLPAAQEDLATAVKDSPGNAGYLATYAWVQQLEDQHTAAIATLSQARALDPKSPVIPYRMAVSYYFLGEFAQAQTYCTEALRLNPKYGAALLLRGITELREKNARGAADSLEEAVRLDPGSALFHRELGEALFDSGKPAAAGKEFDQALALDPKDAEGYFWRAKLLASQGSDRQAVASLNAAVELKPNYSDAYQELARLYTKTGQPALAAKARAQEKSASASVKSSGSGLLRSLPESSE